jgi:hypothetical protein
LGSLGMKVGGGEAFLHWQGIYGGHLVEVGVFQWRYILWSQ